MWASSPRTPQRAARPPTVARARVGDLDPRAPPGLLHRQLDRRAALPDGVGDELGYDAARITAHTGGGLAQPHRPRWPAGRRRIPLPNHGSRVPAVPHARPLVALVGRFPYTPPRN